MIAKLNGRLDSSGEGWAVIDVGGVGYLVFTHSRALSQMGPLGSAVSLLIETHVREDHIHLYGFASTDEREWFRLLQSVQGVGAKSALAVLSVAPPSDLAMAVAAGDKAMFSRAEGIGPKSAARIVSELSDKVARLQITPSTAKAASAGNNGEKGEKGGNAAADAVSALVNLGYGRSEAFAAVARHTDQGDDVSTLIRSALKELSA